MLKRERPYIGIDVCNGHLDFAAHLIGDSWWVANDQAGIQAVVTHLEGLHPASVVVEPTGGLELALAAAGTPVAVVNPRQV
ncbi:MAG: hypothetical protein BZY87_05195 [SAR202 cluster bacterium Io17-Chloro-G6]|nr:MAG: hypothetical protein BZY87_05195 [SAR202 cluster bacterium Io17-Chloro-G6]